MHSPALLLLLHIVGWSVVQSRNHPKPGHIYTPHAIEPYTVVCDNKWVPMPGIQYYYADDAGQSSTEVAQSQIIQRLLSNDLPDCKAAEVPRKGEESLVWEYAWTGVFKSPTAPTPEFYLVPCNETTDFQRLRCCATLSMWAKQDGHGKWTTGACSKY